MRTENHNRASFSPFGQHEISVLIELALGHLRYHLTDVPPQPNSPPNCVCRADQQSKETALDPTLTVAQVSPQRNKSDDLNNGAFRDRRGSHWRYTF